MERLLFTGLISLMITACSAEVQTTPCAPGQNCPEQQQASFQLEYEIADRCAELSNAKAKADCQSQVDAIKDAINQRHTH